MARVNIYRGKTIVFAHKVTGPLVRQTSSLVAQGARRMIPRGNHQSGSGKPQPGLPLAMTVKVDSEVSVYQIVERVGSDKRYAATVHQGSSPHWIQSKGGKKLKFEWERGNLLVQARARGRIRGGRRLRSRDNFFYFVRVRHPGNKRPVRFLTTPMHLYGRMRGFRTTSTPANRSRLP